MVIRRHSNPPVFPGSLPFFGAFSRSPSFWNSSKINVQVIETRVGFSDTCWNGLINLSFVPKPKSCFDRGLRSVSFHNYFSQSSLWGPFSRFKLFCKRGCCHDMLGYVPVKTSLFSNTGGWNVWISMVKIPLLCYSQQLWLHSFVIALLRYHRVNGFESCFFVVVCITAEIVHY